MPLPSGSPSEAPPVATREVLFALPLFSRIAWFALGALIAMVLTLLAVLGPGSRSRDSEHARPYETFPFADNSGVCQEWIALAQLQTSHADASNVARRIAPLLAAPLRAENLRVVRAFVSGDYWTLAVDAQAGTGDEAGARRIADAVNALPGTGLRFSPVFYSSRRLYDTTRVLCMPRPGEGTPPTSP